MKMNLWFQFYIYFFCDFFMFVFENENFTDDFVCKGRKSQSEVE